MKRAAIALAVAALVLPAAAQAEPKRSYVPAGLDQTVATEHFLVHYTNTPGENASDPASAQGLADRAEAAYKLFIGTWGFPAPPSDGDGKTDIYVHHITYTSAQFTGEPLGLSRPDPSTADQTSAAIEVQPFAVTNLEVMPHEFFHVIQAGIYRREAAWVVESTATWAGNRAANTARFLGAFTTPQISLDCVGTAATDCGGDARGYTRWPFWLALDERFGPGFVLDTYRRAGTLGAADHVAHSLEAIGQALAARGSALSSSYVDFSESVFGGTLKFEPLGKKTAKSSETIITPSAAGAMPDKPVALNHLAHTVLKLQGPGGGTCTDATLRLSVSAPAGVPFQPLLRLGSQVFRLPVTGETAVQNVKWSTCSSSVGYLDIQNASPTADNQTFVLGVSLTIPQAAPPPRPNPVRPVVPEQNGPVPPVVLDMRSPRNVTLPRKRRGSTTIRFTVRTDRAGFANVILIKRYIDITKGGDIPIGGDPYSVTKELRLRKGLNRITLKVDNRHRTGRHLIAVQPYSGFGIGDVFDEGFDAARAVFFKRARR